LGGSKITKSISIGTKRSQRRSLKGDHTHEAVWRKRRYKSECLQRIVGGEIGVRAWEYQGTGKKQ